jgi:hypothetical protein
MIFTPPNIIHFLSLILPFANETAIILTESKLPLFTGFYRDCIDVELLKTKKIRSLLENEICNFRDNKIKIIIDLIAYLGIMLFICKNTLHYGYVTGVAAGVVMVFCSMILTNLYLGKIVKYFTRLLQIESPYLFIFIGALVVVGYIIFTNILEIITQKLTKSITIDPEAEKYTE